MKLRVPIRRTPEPPPPGGIGDASPAATPLGTSAKKALWWSVANTFVGRVGTTLIGIVLARILVPEDYGVFAVALVMLNALLSLNELGVSLAIVRWPGDVARIAPTVKTLALVSSVALWIAMFFAAPVLANALSTPEATFLVQLLTLSVLIDAVTAVPAALMTRDFMQRERMIVDTTSFVVSSTLAIGLAVTGHGVYALVVSMLIGNVVNALFMLRYAPRRFKFGWRREVIPELLSFGLPLAGASALLMAMLHIDYVVVGAQLGPVALGFYLLAFNLSTWPVNMFSAPARRVSLPLFARLHAGKTDPSAAFVPVCVMLALVTLPACVLIAVIAEPLVRVVYGEKWVPAAAALPWLMVLALVRVLGELVYDFLTALGKSMPNLVLQVIWLVALIVALPIAVQAGGIEGVAMAHALVAIVIVVPSYTYVLIRSGVSLREMTVNLSRPFVGAGLAASAGLGAIVLGPDDRLVQMGLAGALVVLVYAAVVYPMRGTLNSPALRSA